MNRILILFPLLVCFLPCFGRDNAYTTNKNLLYSKYSIGNWTYGQPNICDYGCGSTLTIGKYCSIANNVYILVGGEHSTDFVTTYPFAALWPESKKLSKGHETKGNTIIGNDVWIGMNVTILSGVYIGDGAVIAAGSVVTKNVAPYTIVGGVPAKPIRTRFPDKVVKKLLKIKWWNWPDEEVANALPYLLSNDIEKFVTIFGD